MRRLLTLDGGHKLVIADGVDWPVQGPAGSSGILAEFLGRYGHPSSYGLLGGTLSTSGETAPSGGVLPGDRKRYWGSLMGESATVSFGLPARYLQEVRLVSDLVLGDRNGLRIEIAAHDSVASSPYVFGALSRFVIMLLQSPDSGDEPDELLAELWNEAWKAQHASLCWEIEVTDVFQLTGRNGLNIAGRWITHGSVRGDSTGILIRGNTERHIDGLVVEFHQPADGIHLFLPGLSKSDLDPGDRLLSPYVSR